MIVADEVAQQVAVCPPDFGGGHRSEPLQELPRLQEFPSRRPGNLEPDGRFDLVHPHKKTVVGRFFRIGKDVVAPHPAEKDEADQQENKDSPSEQAVPLIRPPAVSRSALVSVVALS